VSDHHTNLTAGYHKIYFRGADPNFNTEVTYDLIVGDKNVEHIYGRK
jgi:hypothetical protein